MKIKKRIPQLAMLAVSFASLLWGYRLMLADHAPVAFGSASEDMSYAWYVPLFSLYVLWCRRCEIARSLGGFSFGGLVPLLTALAVGYLGIRGHQLRLEIVGFAGLLVALSWTHFGWRTAREVMFPAAFLLFCLPIAGFLDLFTVHLRLLAVSVAYGVLKGCGAEVIREGTMLASSGGAFAIDVAAPCSGLRSVMAMAALATGYAYFTQPTWLRRGLLILLAIPIAILGNVARILSIVLVGECCSPTFATGFYHDYSGYVVFAVAIALMFAVGELIARGSARRAEAGVDGAEGARAVAPTVRSATHLAASCIVTVLFVTAMVWQGMTPEPLLTEAPTVAFPEIPGYSSVAGEASAAERATLPADTDLLRREYTDAFGARFSVTAVVGGSSKSSIHRPELCLPSQGFEMSRPRTVAAGGGSWRVLTIRRGEAMPVTYAYTFFNQAGFRTSSHVRRIFRDVWDRGVLNRIDRWVMVLIDCNATDDAAFAAFAAKLEGVFR